MRRAIGSVLIGIGVFAVILAILLPTVVVPKSTKTPLNLNVTTIATGPAKLLNASTGQLVDANLRATRTVHSDSHASDSKNTTMDESLCIVNVIGTTPNCVAASDPKGRLLSVTTDRVTTDRVNAMAVFVPGWGANVNGDTSIRHEGLAYKFPINSKQTTYPFFLPDLGKAFPADYVRTEHLNGLKLYVYESKTGTQPYKIQGIADGFYTDTRTVWVEPKTGQIVKGVEKQVQTLASGQVALDTTLTFDDATITAQANTAKKAIKQAQIAGVWLPIILVILGIAALVGGVLMLRNRGEGGATGGGDVPAENAPPDWIPGYGDGSSEGPSGGSGESTPPALSGSSQT